MNSNLNTLRIALSQCLSSPDVTGQEISEVIRETIKKKMDESNITVAKSRTVLDKLQIPHQYTTCPDYLSNPVGAGKSESVTLNYDGIYGASGTDSINLIETIGDTTIPPFV